jgi:sulfur carrier protein ThiS adenylyltransferase
MQVKINEKDFEIDNKSYILDLRNKINPKADVVILNGHLIDENLQLSEKDEIFFIEKGKIPDEDELEALLVARHTPNVHRKLKKAKIAIAGLGGLGSNIAISLARMGVGYLKLVDFDIVEPSNINRQYYFLDQLGMYKTEALKETLNRVNPFIKYEFVNTIVDENNIKQIFLGFDIICEAFDKAETKVMFIRKSMQLFPDTLIIGASGVAGIYPTEDLKIRKVGKNLYIVGDFTNEAKVGQGLMSTRVTVAANIQANLAVRYILGELL